MPQALPACKQHLRSTIGPGAVAAWADVQGSVGSRKPSPDRVLLQLACCHCCRPFNLMGKFPCAGLLHCIALTDPDPSHSLPCMHTVHCGMRFGAAEACSMNVCRSHKMLTDILTGPLTQCCSQAQSQMPCPLCWTLTRPPVSVANPAGCHRQQSPRLSPQQVACFFWHAFHGPTHCWKAGCRAPFVPSIVGTFAKTTAEGQVTFHRSALHCTVRPPKFGVLQQTLKPCWDWRLSLPCEQAAPTMLRWGPS